MSLKEKPSERSASEMPDEARVLDVMQKNISDIDINKIMEQAGVSEENRKDLKTIAIAAVFFINGNPDAALSAVFLGDGRISKFIIKSIVRSEVAAEKFEARVERGLKRLSRLS
jgi:hypothetical protein